MAIERSGTGVVIGIQKGDVGINVGESLDANLFDPGIVQAIQRAVAGVMREQISDFCS